MYIWLYIRVYGGIAVNIAAARCAASAMRHSKSAGIDNIDTLTTIKQTC